MIRHLLDCRGTVQGVGFRPAVHRLARELELSGSVRNGADGAQIQVEGTADAVREFERRLFVELPPLARLASLEIRELEPRASRGFEVDVSTREPRRRALIPPDARLCDACRAELESLGDRRRHYAFTTCTDCGPRFSLVRSLPYDRARTSMAPFPLCAACAAEYADIDDRRYHAEALCCPECGPELRLSGPELPEPLCGEDALTHARAALSSGALLALQGIGGFQLACRADDGRAIERLRRAKRRPTQAFALMVRELAVAHRLAVLEPADEQLLLSPASPILLLPRRESLELDAGVAPGLTDVGLMLPTTPLHVELFRGAPYDALVMTSGNQHHEPIARRAEEAFERLGELADLFLTHEREVVRRVDDSVARSSESGPFLVRRSRGYVPAPLPLPVRAPEPLLALGGYLQGTVCLAVGAEAFLSQHIGDQDSCQARDFLEECCRGLEAFLDVHPRVIVVDEHPDYPSHWSGTQLAHERAGRLVRVQHHLAHAAAVLAEQRVFPARRAGGREAERVGALVLDGTGFGLDGSAWGCEWLLLDGELEWRRAAHARELSLIGGERAIEEPWRVLAAVFAADGELDLLCRLRPELAARVETLASLATLGEWPRSSGAGRLFEAAGVLFGLCQRNSWEGEAAARFESLADAAPEGARAWPELSLDAYARELPGPALLLAAARRLCAGAHPATTALGFHCSFAALAAELSARVLAPEVSELAIGGGCLVNRHLRRDLRREHERRGFQVWLPSQVPPGDGGLAYGQAALAAACLERDRELHYAGEL